MKSSFRFWAVVAVLAATLVGCDWGGVSSEESWNDAYAWANFSGTYKLVTEVVPELDDEDEESNESDDNEEGGSSSEEIIHWDTKDWVVEGSLNNIKEVISFDLPKLQDIKDGNKVVPENVTVEIYTIITEPGETITYPDNSTENRDPITTPGKLVFRDDGNGKLIFEGQGIYSGTISYVNGRVTVDIGNLEATGYHATYSYYVKIEKTNATTNNTTSSSTSATASSTKPSVVLSPITWLNVTQKGNLLTLHDNDGRTYSGKITGASCPDADAGGYVVAGHIRFSFEATCTANSAITISGSLSGDWSGAQNETSGTIDNRTMDASFVNGGSPIQFQAVSGSVTVIAKTVTPVAGETK